MLERQGEEGAFADIPNPNDNNNVSSISLLHTTFSSQRPRIMGLSVYDWCLTRTIRNAVVVNANATIDLGNVTRRASAH